MRRIVPPPPVLQFSRESIEAMPVDSVVDALVETLAVLQTVTSSLYHAHLEIRRLRVAAGEVPPGGLKA